MEEVSVATEADITAEAVEGDMVEEEAAVLLSCSKRCAPNAEKNVKYRLSQPRGGRCIATPASEGKKNPKAREAETDFRRKVMTPIVLLPHRIQESVLSKETMTN